MMNDDIDNNNNTTTTILLLIIMIMIIIILISIIIIIISRCYVKANSFVQFLCPKFALTYNPIVGIRFNVEYMLVIINDNNNNK